MERTPSHIQNHAFKHDNTPPTPLKDIRERPVIAKDEKEVRLKKGFDMLISGEISIIEMSRLRELYDDDYPELITIAEPSSLNDTNEHISDYQRSTLAGELIPRPNPLSKIRTIFNKLPLF